MGGANDTPLRSRVFEAALAKYCPSQPGPRTLELFAAPLKKCASFEVGGARASSLMGEHATSLDRLPAWLRGGSGRKADRFVELGLGGRRRSKASCRKPPSRKHPLAALRRGRAVERGKVEG